MRPYPSAAYAAFSSLEHPTHSIPGSRPMASSIGKAKSPATPNTLDIPMSLSLDRTCSITVVDDCIGSCNISLLDTASFVRADTRDIKLISLELLVRVLKAFCVQNEFEKTPTLTCRIP